MTTDQLFQTLARRRITLFLKEGDLRYRAPSGSLSQDLRDEIAAQRPSLIERLCQKRQSERTGAAHRCKICKPSDWVDDSLYNPIRTICGKCGRFIGYRNQKR